jgi:release factor glutamine methyltransferase
MNYAISALRQEGKLYFEINPIYADSIVEQLQQLGFIDVQKIDDQFGKTRFIKACKR